MPGLNMVYLRDYDYSVYESHIGVRNTTFYAFSQTFERMLDEPDEDTSQDLIAEIENLQSHIQGINFNILTDGLKHNLMKTVLTALESLSSCGLYDEILARYCAFFAYLPMDRLGVIQLGIKVQYFHALNQLGAYETVRNLGRELINTYYFGFSATVEERDTYLYYIERIRGEIAYSVSELGNLAESSTHLRGS